jgi:TetR/AcrR family transcriptional regulator of autoinduction and epiphytic fitness
MPAADVTYHQQVAQQKRGAILDAASQLFLELGYDRTSLAKIAERAGVSRATLFKQFPSKASLFDDMVRQSWRTDDDELVTPPAGDVQAGLVELGTQYAALISTREMTDLFRIVISELPRFPELAGAQFSLGKMPYFQRVRDYLESEVAAGTATVADLDLTSTQFLGMIANYLLWPKLLIPGWSVTSERQATVVAEAATTTAARIAVR